MAKQRHKSCRNPGETCSVVPQVGFGGAARFLVVSSGEQSRGGLPGSEGAGDGQRCFSGETDGIRLFRGRKGFAADSLVRRGRSRNVSEKASLLPSNHIHVVFFFSLSPSCLATCSFHFLCLAMAVWKRERPSPVALSMLLAATRSAIFWCCGLGCSQ